MTATGLNVRVSLVKKRYIEGKKITNQQMDRPLLEQHAERPDWDYSI